MYHHAQKTHQWSQKRKLSWKKKHPQDSLSSGANSEVASSESGSTAVGKVHDRHEPIEHPLDRLEFLNISEPQLGAQHHLVSVSLRMNTDVRLIYPTRT